jgi:stage IV sporulation protein FB
MLRFDVAGFPVGVHWMFWVISALLGGALYANEPAEWADVGIWVGVVFFSILVHELGHALAARHYRLPSEIILHGCGGVTIMPAGHLSRGQSIVVSAAGPTASIGLGVLVWIAARFAPIGHPGIAVAISDALWVNFGWTVINLLPIQPMDGGQILRDLLGPSRFKITCVIGMVCAAAVGALALKVGLTFLAFFMFYFAYLNFVGQAGDGGVITR